MKYDLRKTHYEALKEYLGTSSAERFLFMKDLREKLGNTPSFEEFGKEVGPRIENNSEAHILYHLYMMEGSGEKLFYVTPNLAARLAKTRPNVDSYFLKTPFKWQFVQIDSGLFTVKDVVLNNIDPVHGFYIGLHEEDGIKTLRGMAASLLKPVNGIPFNDTVFYFKINFKQGDIEEQIRHYAENAARNKWELDQFKGGVNIEHVQEFMSFLVNFLLYATSANASLKTHTPENLCQRLEGLKSEAKKRKLQQRIARSPTYRVIIAGDDIPDDSDVEAIRQAGSIGNWKLTKRVLVAAHWRHQWYGSEKDNTRYQGLKWIDNYEKGPELADVLNKKIVMA